MIPILASLCVIIIVYLYLYTNRNSYLKIQDFGRYLVIYVKTTYNSFSTNIFDLHQSKAEHPLINQFIYDMSPHGKAIVVVDNQAKMIDLNNSHLVTNIPNGDGYWISYDERYVLIKRITDNELNYSYILYDTNTQKETGIITDNGLINVFDVYHTANGIIFTLHDTRKDKRYAQLLDPIEGKLFDVDMHNVQREQCVFIARNLHVYITYKGKKIRVGSMFTKPFQLAMNIKNILS